MRIAREAAILATPLPTAEADEVLILIFHREFPDPRNPDVPKRYTYVATWRHERHRWFLTQDPLVRPIRPLDNRDLLLFARPVGPPTRVHDNSFHDNPGPVRVQTWFLPTQASR